ncbi:MAG: hypothetical protein RLZ53_355 [Actinomycetota bacterium]|jgi:PDZ domain-containing protein
MRPLVRKRLGRALAVVSVLGLFWAPLLPLPYVIEEPGPVTDVLGKIDGIDIIEVSGMQTEEPIGVLDLLTVSAYGYPGNTPDVFRLIEAFFDSEKVIIPLDAAFPPGQTFEESIAEGKADFDAAQDDALAAASHVLGPDFVMPKITFHLDDIGGPSGGLIFALGIIDKVTPGQLTGGKAIAGTGTISADGYVGAIGGIRLKMISANRAGDRFFIAPRSNCDEIVGFEPEGLRVIPVDTLREALDVLNVIAADGDLSAFPVCSLK